MTYSKLPNMKPILNNILLKPLQSDEISEGGIFVPLTARKPSNKCVVVAVGRGSANKPMKFKEGEIVYRVKDWGDGLFINGELHYLMNQDAAIAKQ